MDNARNEEAKMRATVTLAGGLLLLLVSAAPTLGQVSRVVTVPGKDVGSVIPIHTGGGDRNLGGRDGAWPAVDLTARLLISDDCGGLDLELRMEVKELKPNKTEARRDTVFEKVYTAPDGLFVDMILATQGLLLKDTASLIAAKTGELLVDPSTCAGCSRNGLVDEWLVVAETGHGDDVLGRGYHGEPDESRYSRAVARLKDIDIILLPERRGLYCQRD